MMTTEDEKLRSGEAKKTLSLGADFPDIIFSFFLSFSASQLLSFSIHPCPSVLP
jgi:hypothetical protein